ncbi:MAG TPA: hypothetical protein VFA89_11620 [Terriglobales bacterium]|nr:hypothetical protein [Terriglobales bacterium]
MSKLLIDGLGWLGAFILLTAYASVSFRKIAADGALYQWVNATGSLLLIVNTVYYRAYPSAFVNVIWIAIAISARIRVRSYAGKAQ